MLYFTYRLQSLESKVNVLGSGTKEHMTNGINEEALASLSSMYNDGKLKVTNLEVTGKANIGSLTTTYSRTLNGLWFGPNSGVQRYIAPGSPGNIRISSKNLIVSDGGMSFNGGLTIGKNLDVVGSMDVAKNLQVNNTLSAKNVNVTALMNADLVRSKLGYWFGTNAGLIGKAHISAGTNGVISLSNG
jgi:hypothetical protein